MRSARAVAFAAVLLALSAMGQTDDGFAETAPPKVALPMTGEAAVPEAGKAPANAEPEARPDPLIAEIGAIYDEADSLDDTGTAPVPTEPAAGSGSSMVSNILKGIMGLTVALAIYLLALAAVKRWGKRSPLLAGQQFGQILGRVALSPQASLHFVRTNGEVLVVGVTPQSVTLLRTFDAEDFEPAKEAEAAPGNVTGASFLAQLKEAQGAMTAAPGVDEELDNLKGDLQRLKQYFQDSARARD